MDNYHLLLEGQNNVVTHFISTSIDLVDQYKTFLLNGKGYLIWEDGVIDCSKVLGITRQKRVT